MGNSPKIEVVSLIRQDERFVPLTKANVRLGDEASRSIDGAILLTIDGVELLDVGLWDDIDGLWIGLLNGLCRAKQGLKYEGSFPGQPVPVEIEPWQNDQVRIAIGPTSQPSVRMVCVSASPLNLVMADAGAAFFRWLEKVSPQRFPATWAHIAFLKGEGPPTETWTLERA